MALPTEATPKADLNTIDRLYVATSEGIVGPSGAVELLEGQNAGSIAVDNSGLWVLVDTKELHRVDERGAQLVATIDDGTGVCVHAHHDEVYVGGDSAMLWRLDDRRLTKMASFSEAPSRNEWYTPWGGPPSVFSMADHGRELYVSVHVGGILMSADNGRSWRPTIDLHDDVHQVTVGGDGTVYAATGRNGLAESNDHGRSWRYHTRGLHATYLLAVAATSQGVLVGASSGHAATNGAVYLFDGTDLAPVAGLPERLNGAVGPGRIVADGDHAALVDPNGDVHISSDGGRHWRRAYGPLTSPTQPVLKPIA